MVSKFMPLAHRVASSKVKVGSALLMVSAMLIGMAGPVSAQDAPLAAADGVVVGTALCNAIGQTLEDGAATPRTVPAAQALVEELAAGTRRARA